MENIGCRIPRLYFATTGAGQSSEGAGVDHWETASYDIALLDAGIENFNVMTYTSVLPPEAEEITFDEAKEYFHHGAVLETIKAQINGAQGDHICAGVGRCKVYQNGKLIGGFAAEYEGNASCEMAKRLLAQDLLDIVKRRYGMDYEIKDMKFDVRDLVVDEQWGTVFAALCFVTYVVKTVFVKKRGF